MSYPLIREQTAAILAAVEGMGVVHQYQRLATTWGKFLELFRDQNKKINGCVITRTSISEKQNGVNEKQTAHMMILRFYCQVNDAEASEIVFQQMLDDARAAFKANKTLNDTCSTTHSAWTLGGALGLNVKTIDNRMFGSVLCHFAEADLAPLEQTAD
jgi:hypothetical protein